MALKETRPVMSFRWSSDQQQEFARKAAEQAGKSLNVWLEDLVDAALTAKPEKPDAQSA